MLKILWPLFGVLGMVPVLHIQFISLMVFFYCSIFSPNYITLVKPFDPSLLLCFLIYRPI